MPCTTAAKCSTLSFTVSSLFRIAIFYDWAAKARTKGFLKSCIEYLSASSTFQPLIPFCKSNLNMW